MPRHALLRSHPRQLLYRSMLPVAALVPGPPAGAADPAVGRSRVPPRALVISAAALLIPLYGSLYSPDATRDYEMLLWLLALVPAFLFSYYRGWPGAAFALAVGMGVLATTQVVVVLAGRPVQNWPMLLMVIAAYIAIVLGVGWISELLHRQRAHAEQMALTDELTGLANRRSAVAALERDFAAAERGRELAIVLFDLDRFREYNDRHGHEAGDDALRAFGRVLRQTTRRMNLSARYGGEEFLVILNDTHVGGALVFIERVRTGLLETSLPAGPITCSAGVAAYAAGMRSAEDLVRAADRALYAAKAEGRDCVRTADVVAAGPQAFRWGGRSAVRRNRGRSRRPVGAG